MISFITTYCGIGDLEHPLGVTFTHTANYVLWKDKCTLILHVCKEMQNNCYKCIFAPSGSYRLLGYHVIHS